MARAKVAQNYLKNCSCVWIVAPIKRAVDDGIAKDLMRDSFKRRPLMDGQYGKVAFICTQADDVRSFRCSTEEPGAVSANGFHLLSSKKVEKRRKRSSWASGTEARSSKEVEIIVVSSDTDIKKYQEPC